MARREKLSNPPSLVMWMKYDGNLMEEVSGVDFQTMYHLPNSAKKNWTWVDDPAGTNTKCCRRSTSTSKNNGFPSEIVDTRELFYYTGGDFSGDCFKWLSECKTSDSSSVTVFMTGMELEFEWYPNTNNSGNAYILASWDSLYGGGNANMDGTDIIRNGTRLFAKTRAGETELFTITTGRWYRLVIDYIGNNNNTQTSQIRIYDESLSTPLVATASVTIPAGVNSSNKLSRILHFFNSIWDYHATAPNTTDYLRNVKVWQL